MASLPLFDIPGLQQLLRAFRLSMKRLLVELCDELDEQEYGATDRRKLPVGFFRSLAQSLDVQDFDHERVVGWIESLNDLVYFLDVSRQWSHERARAEFAEQLLSDCTEKLYEHSYLDELFPLRRPEPRALATRLNGLCRRLSREVVQESLWLVPGLPCRWMRETGLRAWTVEGTLGPNYERVEAAGSLSIGLDGTVVRLPGVPRRHVPQAQRVKRDQRDRRDRGIQQVVRFVILPSQVDLRIGAARVPLCRVEDAVSWHGGVQPPRYIIPPNATWRRGLVLGPTLVYDRHRLPVDVRPSPANLVERVRRAVTAVEASWPTGYALLALLTSRLVPLQAKGVVSFSYRHRPGLSCINMFERTQLDLVDDLIHENSHHHLNLLLRKAVLYKGDENQELFYSPWRRSLRPLRGILHATFTFSMGALLFHRLSAWGRSRPIRWRSLGLTQQDLCRARARCVEEVASVRYALQDLAYADDCRGWIRPPGRQLVAALDSAIREIERPARSAERSLSNVWRAPLRRHLRELEQARQTYGPSGHSPR